MCQRVKLYGSFDLGSSSPSCGPDDDAIIDVARSFLAGACPALLDVLEKDGDGGGGDDARDRLLKVGRNLNATLREYDIPPHTPSPCDRACRRENLKLFSFSHPHFILVRFTNDLIVSLLFLTYSCRINYYTTARLRPSGHREDGKGGKRHDEYMVRRGDETYLRISRDERRR